MVTLDQGRHHHLGVERTIPLGKLVALEQVEGDEFSLEPLERERDAHPVRCLRTPVSEELHVSSSPDRTLTADAIRYADYASRRSELTINISGGVHHETLVSGNHRIHMFWHCDWVFHARSSSIGRDRLGVPIRWAQSRQLDHNRRRQLDGRR